MARRFMVGMLWALVASGAGAEIPRAYAVAGQLWLTVSGPECCDGRVFTGNFQLAFEVASGTGSFNRVHVDLEDTHLDNLGFLGLGSTDIVCAWAEENRPFSGWVGADGLIWIDPEMAKLQAVSSTERRAGACGPPTIAALAANRGPLVGWHDPAGNAFWLYGSFGAEIEGDTYILTLAFVGSYSNRPPVTRLGFAPPLAQEGPCPAILAGIKPEWVVVANSPLGYKAEPVSLSTDPDGVGGRGGIASELWTVKKNNDPTVILGLGRRLGSVLFELGQRYRVELLVSDHRGATHLDTCTFRVVSSLP